MEIVHLALNKNHLFKTKSKPTPVETAHNPYYTSASKTSCTVLHPFVQASDGVSRLHVTRAMPACKTFDYWRRDCLTLKNQHQCCSETVSSPKKRLLIDT